jgi:hypothetical protein
MPFRKITHCPHKHHVLHPATHKPQLQHSMCAASDRSYHKWSEEGTPYMTCPCGYKVCIACAEVGMYEEGGAELDKQLSLVVEEIGKDRVEKVVMERLAVMERPGLEALTPFLSALSGAYSFYELAHHGSLNVALWRACCRWRTLHAKLAGWSDVELRALCVAAASKDDTGKQLATLIRMTLVKKHGKLAVPEPKVFLDRLASSAASLHLENNRARCKACAGLVLCALGASGGGAACCGACTIA